MNPGAGGFQQVGQCQASKGNGAWQLSVKHLKWLHGHEKGQCLEEYHWRFRHV